MATAPGAKDGAVMGPRRVGLGLGLALVLAACQPGTGAAPPDATPPPGTAATSITTAPNPPDATAPGETASGEVAALDGTLEFTSDGTSSSDGSTTETHGHMSLTVHMVSADGGFHWDDAGSTFAYTETSKSHDPQTVSQCGLDTTSEGTGSGPFAPPEGRIVAIYSTFNGTAGLGVHAPYQSAGTLTFLCNGLTHTAESSEVENPSCGDPADGLLVGNIVPGNTVDFTCSESFAVGQGGVKVTGTLTTR